MRGVKALSLGLIAGCKHGLLNLSPTLVSATGEMHFSDSMPFEHLPLKRGEIRLITLQPIGDSGEGTLPIRCGIEHIELPRTASLADSNLKGNDFVWPEVNYSLNTSRIFKDPSPRSKLFSDMFYSTSPKVEAENPSETESAQKDYISDEMKQPWRQEWGDYVALSYCWGPPAPTKQIFLEAERLDVTPNFSDALLHLRCTERIRQGFKIWIDAICINQSGDAEKEHQIPLMRQIYATSWQVLTWVGTSQDDNNLAITTLRYLASRMTLPAPLTGLHEERVPKNPVPMAEMWTIYKIPFHKTVHRAL